MPSSTVRSFTDPDAYHAAIRDAHAEGIVTGRGVFRAELTKIGLTRISLQRGSETLPPGRVFRGRRQDMRDCLSCLSRSARFC